MTKVEIDHVSKRIGTSLVLDGITMTLHGGQAAGLKGVNGSGKTMLMRLMAGLILPTEGEVRIDGRVLGRDMEFPERTGILIENPAFLEYASGYQNLKLLASIRREADDKRICETLKRVGLDPEDKKKYKKYSLGMKQRLGIAAAILEEPDILILDEPVNALDSDGVEIVRSVLWEEKERGALIVMSCHDTPFLEEMTDVIYELKDGRLLQGEGLM
ncbi:MAG: ATP-binding cassette domain-containing protein [Roseburia sp.]|nr:ATP-binding cassette domain-containing protein [Roseburia sp.]